jgi:hypothetical protein
LITITTNYFPLHHHPDLKPQIFNMRYPFVPRNHALGAPANKTEDIAPSAVFMVLFLACLIFSIRIMKQNAKNGHNFIMIRPLVSFSAIRVISTALRIASACHPKNISLAIAANIFILAGVVLLYILNFFFVQRILRARLAHLGWTKLGGIFPWIGLGVTAATLAMTLTAVIDSFYTLETSILAIDRVIQKVGTLVLLVLAVLPVPMLVIIFLIPKRVAQPTAFGKLGTFQHKVIILLGASVLLTLGAGFRAGTTWMPLVSNKLPTPWYFAKGYFYCFDLMIDFLALASYLLLRVDQRFHVADGAKTSEDYENGAIFESNTEKDIEKGTESDSDSEAEDKSDLESVAL